MKKLTFLFSFLLINLITNAQIIFQKTYGGTNGDQSASSQQTADGGFIICGFTTSFGLGYADVYLVKTNLNGDTLWTKTFGGTNGEVGNSVVQTDDGGYIITGWTISFGAGYQDVYLIKTDNNGNLLWSKTFGGTNRDEGYSVRQTNDGGYIIVGRTCSFGADTNDVYLIKTNSFGDSLWTKTFGGTGNDYGYSVQQTTDGGYIVSGKSNSFSGNVDDIYLIKTDSTGNLIWTKTLGTGDAQGWYVLQTADGGYIITGNVYNFGTGTIDDVYLIKTDANGDTLWCKSYGGAVNDGGYAVKQTQDSGYIIIGVTYSFGAGDLDAYLIKTDSIGNLIWAKTYGGLSYDNGNSVNATIDGGYLIGGLTYNLGSGGYDFYLIKTDSLGNSGCNEGNPATIVTTPVLQVASPATIVTSPPTVVTTPSTLVSSGCIVTTLCSNVGINEITKDNSYFILPNPSAGNFVTSFERIIMKGKVDIFNTLGENIFTEVISNESKKEINLKNIQAGIYFVKVNDGEKSYCKKLIIEHN